MSLCIKTTGGVASEEFGGSVKKLWLGGMCFLGSPLYFKVLFWPVY